MIDESSGYILGTLYFSFANPEKLKEISESLLMVLGKDAKKYDLKTTQTRSNVKNTLYRPVFNYFDDKIHLRGAGLFGHAVFHVIFPVTNKNFIASYRMTRAKFSSITTGHSKKFSENYLGNTVLLCAPESMKDGKEPEAVIAEITDEKKVKMADTAFGQLFQVGELLEKTHRFFLFKKDDQGPLLDLISSFFPLIDLPAHRIFSVFNREATLSQNMAHRVYEVNEFLEKINKLLAESDSTYRGNRIEEVEFLATTVREIEAGLLELDSFGEKLTKGLKIFSQVNCVVLKQAQGSVDNIFRERLAKCKKLLQMLKTGEEPARRALADANDLLYSFILSKDLTEQSALISLLHQIILNKNPLPEIEELLIRMKEGLGISDEDMERLVPIMDMLPEVPQWFNYPKEKLASLFQYYLQQIADSEKFHPREGMVLKKIASTLNIKPEEMEKYYKEAGVENLIKEKPVEDIKKTPTSRFAGSAVKILDRESLYKVARNEFKSKRYETAKEFFKISVNSFPGDHDALLLLSQSYFYLGQHEKALQNLNMLFQVGCTLPAARFYKSLCLLKKNQLNHINLDEFSLEEISLDDSLLFVNLLRENNFEEEANQIYEKFLTPQILKKRFPERYKVLKVLGEGGMGIVFDAHDGLLDVDIALKLVRPQLSHNQELLEVLLREAHIMAILNSHPNTVQVYDIETHGLPYIVMAKIAGGSVRNLLQKQGKLSCKNVKHIGKQVLEVLVYAHEDPQLGLIHRDIKPENIMIGKDGHVFVTDFGLAEFEKDIGIEDMIVGTPAYMAPEQFRGHSVDFRADIYSFGIMVYEMLTGVLPHSPAFFKKVVFDPEPPKKHIPNLNAKWNACVLKAIAREPAKRHQNCHELFQEWLKLPE
ncbi:protein kinase [Candidatus Riflebacteria bacterium]